MPTFAQLNQKTQLIEIIDMDTGLVVAVQKDHRPLLMERRELLVERVLPDGSTVLMQAGIDPGALALTTSYPFSQITVDLICQLVCEGQSIMNVCKKPGFPNYATLCQWRRQHPHIEKQLEQARVDRGEYYRDRAVQEAELSESTKDPINASALKVDTYKWAAGMDNAKFSPKSKVEATLNTPVQIMVATGIDRTPITMDTTREVSDGKITDQKQIATAMPDSSRGTPGADQGNSGRESTLEVHPISSTTFK
jgi:hypothetical protein